MIDLCPRVYPHRYRGSCPTCESQKVNPIKRALAVVLMKAATAIAHFALKVAGRNEH